jgi:cell division protein FtsN
VRVGPFPHREEAASKMRALQARGYKAFIASAED